MAVDEERRKDLRAAVEARRDLGRDYEGALVESFLDRIERDLDERLDRFAYRVQRRPRGDASIPIALGSLGLGIPLSGIAGGTGGLGGLLTAWGGIVAVNLAHAWGRRRSSG